MKLKLDPWATLPTMAHPDDAGWDLYAPEDCVLPGGLGSVDIHTGLHVQLPRATGGLIMHRSSMFKRRIFSLGLLDPGYAGEIVVTLINADQEDYHIAKGDRIAQLVIMGVMRGSWEIVDELAPSARGSGGFGSSGK